MRPQGAGVMTEVSVGPEIAWKRGFPIIRSRSRLTAEKYHRNGKPKREILTESVPTAVRWPHVLFLAL